MATPVLTYGSKTWTMTKNEERRIQTNEMKFLRKTKDCTLRNQIRNEDIFLPHKQEKSMRKFFQFGGRNVRKQK